MPMSVLRAALGRMRFTLHATRRTPHGASRLAQENVCLVGEKPDVLRPGIVGMRVNDHTTTAMHKLSTPPPKKNKQTNQLILHNKNDTPMILGSRASAIQKSVVFQNSPSLAIVARPSTSWNLRPKVQKMSHGDKQYRTWSR